MIACGTLTWRLERTSSGSPAPPSRRPSQSPQTAAPGGKAVSHPLRTGASCEGRATELQSDRVFPTCIDPTMTASSPHRRQFPLLCTLLLAFEASMEPRFAPEGEAPAMIQCARTPPQREESNPCGESSSLGTSSLGPNLRSGAFFLQGQEHGAVSIPQSTRHGFRHLLGGRLGQLHRDAERLRQLYGEPHVFVRNL